MLHVRCLHGSHAVLGVPDAVADVEHVGGAAVPAGGAGGRWRALRELV